MAGWPEPDPELFQAWSVPVLAAVMDEFVEAALVAVSRFLLIEESQIGLVELLEKLAPGQHIQLAVLGIEIQPKDARVIRAHGVGHGRRLAASFLRPAADGLVIAGHLGFGHGLLLAG